MKKVSIMIVLVLSMMLCACQKSASTQLDNKENQINAETKKESDETKKESAEESTMQSVSIVDALQNTSFASAEEAFAYLYGSEAKPVVITLGINKNNRKIPEYEILIPSDTKLHDINSSIGSGYNTFRYESEDTDSRTTVEEGMDVINAADYIPMEAWVENYQLAGDSGIGFTTFETKNAAFVNIDESYQQEKAYWSDNVNSLDYNDYVCEELDDNSFMFYTEDSYGFRRLTVFINMDDDSYLSCEFNQLSTTADIAKIINANKLLITPITLTDEEIESLEPRNQDRAISALEFFRNCKIVSVLPIDDDGQAIEDYRDEDSVFFTGRFNESGEIEYRETDELVYQDAETGTTIIKRVNDNPNSPEYKLIRFDSYTDEKGKPNYIRSYMELYNKQSMEPKYKDDVIECAKLLGIELE